MLLEIHLTQSTDIIRYQVRRTRCAPVDGRADPAQRPYWPRSRWPVSVLWREFSRIQVIGLHGVGAQSKCHRFSLPPLAGRHEIDLTAAAARAHKPLAPLEHGGLGAVAGGHSAGSGSTWCWQLLHHMIRRTPAAARRASSVVRGGFHWLRRRLRTDRVLIAGPDL
jgi:hypothetical protein